MSKHILVFDSGLGGTTVLQEIHRCLPNYHYSYALDNAAFPYGDKDNDFLFERISSFLQQITKYSTPDLVVIACNTASTLILDHLREQFSMPFVGVVPAIKPAAQISQTKTIALLATEATIQREYIDLLHDDHASHCHVVRLGCQKLVAIAESKLQGQAVSLNELQHCVTQLLANHEMEKVDTVILGCTHFPALQDELKQVWPQKVHWIDSGEAIANRVKSLLNNIPTTSSVNQQPPTLTNALFTTSTAQYQDGKLPLLPCLQPFGLKSSHLIEL